MPENFEDRFVVNFTEGVIRTDLGDTSFVVSPIVVIMIADDIGVPTPTVTITDDQLVIGVTGVNNVTIRWVTCINTTEVGFIRVP